MPGETVSSKYSVRDKKVYVTHYSDIACSNDPQEEEYAEFDVCKRIDYYATWGTEEPTTEDDQPPEPPKVESTTQSSSSSSSATSLFVLAIVALVTLL